MGGEGFQTFHVRDAQAGLALGAVLRQFLPGATWSQVRRLVENRHVQVNGNLSVDYARRLKPGDVLRVWKEPLPPPPSENDLRIRYCDEHIVVVEKPAGITVMRHAEERFWPQRRRQRQPTLDELLQRVIARMYKPKGKGSKGHVGRVPRVRAVHRLDRDTSGLMVFALTAEAQRRLLQMFRQHQVQRKYIALVIGRMEAQKFDTFLVRDRGDGRRGSTREPGVGKRAITHVRPLEHLEGFTLLECRLQTGRTHQIRIHLAEAGHMVCGEKVYTRPFFGRPQRDPSGATRHALHAAELRFSHPITGAPLAFEMPLPADMQQLLNRLRKQGNRGGK
jgi:23S rRNA pseudouridine1911/1915/1917 synthase